MYALGASFQGSQHLGHGLLVPNGVADALQLVQEQLRTLSGIINLFFCCAASTDSRSAAGGAEAELQYYIAATSTRDVPDHTPSSKTTNYINLELKFE